MVARVVVFALDGDDDDLAVAAQLLDGVCLLYASPSPRDELSDRVCRLLLEKKKKKKKTKTRTTPDHHDKTYHHTNPQSLH
jgi:hypothetical protein